MLNLTTNKQKKKSIKMMNKLLTITLMLLGATLCENFCTEGACAECKKVGEHMSCNYCYKSILAPAEENSQTVFKCVGQSTGNRNCLIAENGQDPNKTGCKVCELGWYLETIDKDGSPGVKAGVCREGSIKNCGIYNTVISG
jgi:hypothetical protein